MALALGSAVAATSAERGGPPAAEAIGSPPSSQQMRLSCGGAGFATRSAAIMEESSTSPTREVAMHVLHMRSAPLGVAHRNLLQGLDSARRLDALEWLVQAFDALALPDSHLFSAFGLLDRFAASSPAPISAGPGAFALVLASMLVALKVSGTQRDLDRAKRLVVEVSGSPKPWASVRKAELCILRRLGFRACTPTARDLLDRIAADASAQAEASMPSDALWDTDVRARCADLARCLLELALVHEPWAVYGTGRPPLASALAALLLAQLALSAPRNLVDALQEPLRILDHTADAVVTEIAEAMRQRWITEDKRTSSGSSSAVMDKWLRRMGGNLGATPPNAGDLRFLTAPLPAEAPRDSARARSPAGTAFATLGGKAPVTAVPAIPVQAAVPAPGAALSAASMTASTTTLSSCPGPASMSVSDAPPALEEAQRTLPTPRPALCPAPATGPALASRFPPAQLATQLSRTAASENLSSWPLSASGCNKDARPPSPQQASKSASQALLPGRPGAKAVHQPGGAIATNFADGQKSPENANILPSQPLVELAHVLNMVGTRMGPGSGSGATFGTGAKQRAPVAEVLVSSALRLSWPDERRKVPRSEAAEACRDAILALQEAASQLEGAAGLLDGGSTAVHREFKPTALGSESKRRRTFAGPTLARAPSPGAAGPPAPRGSPPVRLSGLRV